MDGRDAKYCDVVALLPRPELVGAYTPEVHAQLLALMEPLTALLHDVNDRHKAIREPPVRAIGFELDRLGGLVAQQAVYYAMQQLLCNEVSWCEDGVWTTVGTSLTLVWDGCGEWIS